jgi:sulfonate transport system permease protein
MWIEEQSTEAAAIEPVIAADDAPPAVRPPVAGVVAGAAWLAAAAVTVKWPDLEETPHTSTLAALQIAIGLTALGLAVGAPWLRAAGRRLRVAAPWLLALALWVTAWQLATAKLGLLPRPFFAPPQALIEVYVEDWRRLLECTAHSLALLGAGFLIGGLAGFGAGVAIGWSRAAAYWGHPLLRLVGPVPATAWLPLAFFVFPSSRSASVFLIALAAGIPVAVLTWSGVAGVKNAYYDIARTLGASPRFLVLRVAIPAALPHVFVGLFMGLCASFSVLVVAEMLGVKAGLGWYLSWAQGWAAYVNMFAALLFMALVFCGLIALLFAARDRLLGWQSGLVRW